MAVITGSAVVNDARRAGYTTWRAFADGAQHRDRLRPGEQRTTYNIARTLVRKTASYVFPAPPSFNIVDQFGTPTDNDRTENLLMATYQQLDLYSHDVAMEIESSTIGDAAEKVTWDPKLKRPRVVSVDPATLDATWSPDNPQVPQSIKQTYTTPAWAMAPYGAVATDPTQSVEVIETWTSSAWVISIPTLRFEKAMANPYGWIPYLVLANRTTDARSFWGTSDLVDIAEPIKEFNREMSAWGQIMELSGAPITVLKGIDGSEGIRVRPGAKWEIPLEAEAALLSLIENGGMELHERYVDMLRRTIDDISETPKSAYGSTDRTLSGAAIELDLQPMVQKTRRKRSRWEPLYTARNARILDLFSTFGGVEVGEDRTTTTIWPPILPSDDDSLVRQQVQLVNTGIRSRYTANKALGSSDPDKELQRIRDEEDLQAAGGANNGIQQTANLQPTE